MVDMEESAIAEPDMNEVEKVIQRMRNGKNGSDSGVVMLGIIRAIHIKF